MAGYAFDIMALGGEDSTPPAAAPPERELQSWRIYNSRPKLAVGTDWTSSTDTAFEGTYRHLHRAAKEKARRVSDTSKQDPKVLFNGFPDVRESILIIAAIEAVMMVVVMVMVIVPPIPWHHHDRRFVIIAARIEAVVMVVMMMMIIVVLSELNVLACLRWRLFIDSLQQGSSIRDGLEQLGV